MLLASDEAVVSARAMKDVDVAGLVLRLLGRMPRRGDSVTVALPTRYGGDGRPHRRSVQLGVGRLDGLRIDRVTLRVSSDDTR